MALFPASGGATKNLITSTSSSSKSIPSGTTTGFMSITLPAGHTYLITGSHEWQNAVDNVYTSDSLAGYIVKSSNGMYFGGGVNISGIYQATGGSDTTITWEIYQGSGSARTATYGKLMAWQLD